MTEGPKIQVDSLHDMTREPEPGRRNRESDLDTTRTGLNA